MARLSNAIACSTATVIFFCLLGCGGDGLDFNGSYQVDDIHVFARDITIGEQDVVEVFFQTKTEIFGDPDAVDVVVQLDPALAYEPDSSYIYDGSTSEKDRRSPDAVVPCPDGRTFVVYRFSDDELENRELDESGHFGLRLGVIGAGREENAYIEGAADDEQEFSCARPFTPEADEELSVGRVFPND